MRCGVCNFGCLICGLSCGPLHETSVNSLIYNWLLAEEASAAWISVSVRTAGPRSAPRPKN